LAGEAETLAKLIWPAGGPAVDATRRACGGRRPRYAACGISTTTNVPSWKRPMTSWAAGMKILIARVRGAEFDALHPLIASHPRRVMLCSDRQAPDDLARTA